MPFFYVFVNKYSGDIKIVQFLRTHYQQSERFQYTTRRNGNGLKAFELRAVKRLTILKHSQVDLSNI